MDGSQIASLVLGAVELGVIGTAVVGALVCTFKGALEERRDWRYAAQTDDIQQRVEGLPRSKERVQEMRRRTGRRKQRLKNL